MEIRLQKTSIANFKGIKELSFEFDGNATISGANGTGKTTVVDAFWWCLFGKNSSQSAKFSVATLDKNGNIIPDIDSHTVQLELNIDGEIKTFCRKQKENKHGGSTTEFSVDGFKKSLKEYNEIVATVCSEDLFKSITTPFYFLSQKWQDQRTFLISLCDTSAISVSEEFKNLIETCKKNGVTITDYIKGKQSDIKSLRSDIEKKNAVCTVLEQQISELSENFSALQTENLKNNLPNYKTNYSKNSKVQKVLRSRLTTQKKLLSPKSNNEPSKRKQT